MTAGQECCSHHHDIPASGTVAATLDTGTGFSALLGLLRPVRGQLLVAVTAQALGSLLGLVPLIAIYELAKRLMPLLVGGSVDTARVWSVAWLLLLALLAMLASLSVAAIASHLADNRLGLSIRRDLVDHLGRVPLSWFEAHNSGTVKKTVQDDVAALHHMIGHGTIDITAALVTPFAILAYLLMIDWRLTLITLAPIVLGFAAFSMVIRGVGAKYAEYDRCLASLNGSVVEFVNGISVIKAFGETGKAHRRYDEAAAKFCGFFHEWVTQNVTATIVFEIAISSPAILTCTVLGGGFCAYRGWIAPIDILPFALLGLGLTASVMRLLYGGEQMRQAMRAAERIRGVLAVPPLPETAVSDEPKTERGLVEFRDVSFSYDGSKKVLRDINLTLQPGTITALVGPSGSGKSTLAKLLPRFADVDQGRILLDGIDLRDIPNRRLYRRVGFVFQDVSLLRISIRENIRLGRPDASDDEVMAAARAAQIHDRISELPRGYDSVVGEDGMLSGGEAQRVSIARALLADTPLLVLDEATAFADPDSEAAIQDALSRLVKGRTLLVIAHRLHTIAQADQIAVLHDGVIVESGRHDDLLNLGGLYHRLWRASESSRDMPTSAPATEKLP